MPPYPKLAARLRVPSGFLVATLYAIFSRPSATSLMVGLPVALMGLLLRGWAAGHLAKNEALATGGPFAYTRNPLYLGSLLAAAGLALAGRNLWLAVLFSAYFVLIYLPVIGEEECHLRQLFAGYADYAARVPRVLPRLSPAFAATSQFRRDLYRKNREGRALLAYLAGAALLLTKLILAEVTK